MAALILLLACNLDAIEGGDCLRLPEGRNREDCVYASVRTVRDDDVKLDGVLAPLGVAERDEVLLRLVADEPAIAERLCVRVSEPVRSRCGSGSVVPR